MQEVRKISGGIYLIADAGLDNKILLKKLDEALKSGVSVVQLYNTENELSGQVTDINFICNLCHQYHVPVLVNPFLKKICSIKNHATNKLLFANITPYSLMLIFVNPR